MNFREYYNLAKSGKFMGLPIGKGLKNFSNTISGLQRQKIYTIASPSKVGKTTLVNYAFILNPVLYADKHNIDIEIIYYSLEMPVIQQEFYFTTMYMALINKDKVVYLEDGRTKNGMPYVPISPELLMGRMADDNGNQIFIDKKTEEEMFSIYDNKIAPLFRKYIKIVDIPDNPTGIYKNLINHMKKQGELIREKGQFEKSRYIPKNPNKYTIVVIDHLRKLLPERGWGKKQTIDKMAEYEVILRNVFGITFVNIIHLNRSFESAERYRMFGDQLFPSSENIKDTGNLAEESDYVITMMNPNDEKYQLNSHFGLKLYDSEGNLKYPGLRTVHLVDSRWTISPKHFRVIMDGNRKIFKQFKK